MDVYTALRDSAEPIPDRILTKVKTVLDRRSAELNQLSIAQLETIKCTILFSSFANCHDSGRHASECIALAERIDPILMKRRR